MDGGSCWARNMGIETDLMIQAVPSLVQQCERRVVNGWPPRKSSRGSSERPSLEMHLFSFTKFYLFRQGKVNGLHYESEQVT